jgi:acyl-CoA dehydrogenase
MTSTANAEPIDGSSAAARATRHAAIYPQVFSAARRSVAADTYFADSATASLAQFFENKGLAALREEEQREQWYEDWISYQAEHRIYASVLSPRQYSRLGTEFDVLRYARFLEVFGYFSPGHGYSAQVTSLGLFAILMGTNEGLKREAVASLEGGGLLAFGVSEKHHGSDLLANDFTIRQAGAGRFIANGSKYYIGNCNAASIICTLAKKETRRSEGSARRAQVALVAVRPGQSRGFHLVRKIRTFGVRAAFVGEFEVKDYDIADADLIAEGRQAWDAVLGAVTLGKFFLSFGSIGICERAFAEALDHLSARVLYGKPVIDMPHIRATMAQAYARLTAMKLFAFRALDYLHAAREEDRRYLLFCAVQKAKVSTEGVKVMALLAECVGAKGFETDTFFEMALRDIQLFPGLESSAHINLGLTAQFASAHLEGRDENLVEPESLHAAGKGAPENVYLMTAPSRWAKATGFPPFLRAYRPLRSIPNVRLFARQSKAFARVLRTARDAGIEEGDTRFAMALGQCVATIAYGQLIAEHARHLALPREMVSAIFHLLVSDLNSAVIAFKSLLQPDVPNRNRVRRTVAIPRTTQAEWDFVAAQMRGTSC